MQKRSHEADIKDAVIVICSSGFYVQHTLMIYEAAQKRNRFVFIFAGPAEAIYFFLAGLNLKNCHVEHIQVPFNGLPLLKIWRLPALILGARRFAKNSFGRFLHCDCYFFGTVCDAITALPLGILRKRNKLIFSGERSHNAVPAGRISVLKWWHNKIMSIVTGVSHKPYNIGKREAWQGIPAIDESRLAFSEQPLSPKPELLARYAYTPEGLENNRFIIFLESKAERYFENYEETCKVVLGCLAKAGYHVAIKPHPRVGCAEFLERAGLPILPAFVPAQFLARKNILAVIGQTSTSLGDFARGGLPTFCLEGLFQWRSEQSRLHFVEMLSNPAFYEGNKCVLQFPKSVRELLQALDRAADNRQSNLSAEPRS